MSVPFRSLLYSEPWLYDVVFPDADDRTATMCREAFARHLAAPPGSVLDVGCGTGRLLASLSATVPDCWGVDLLASNVAYARSARPALRVEQGDMRSFRLGRTFDAVISSGNALSYALTDADLERTVETLAAHAAPGALLIVDVLNARSYLDGDGVRDRIEGAVDTAEFQATYVATHTLDRSALRLARVRVWRIAGRPDVEDHAEYRLVYPDELRRLLRAGGFEVVGLSDNRDSRRPTWAARRPPPLTLAACGAASCTRSRGAAFDTIRTASYTYRRHAGARVALGMSVSRHPPMFRTTRLRGGA